jgi:hypothetical protein
MFGICEVRTGPTGLNCRYCNVNNCDIELEEQIVWEARRNNIYFDAKVERRARVFFRMGTRSHMLIGTLQINSQLDSAYYSFLQNVTPYGKDCKGYIVDFCPTAARGMMIISQIRLKLFKMLMLLIYDAVTELPATISRIDLRKVYS